MKRRVGSAPARFAAVLALVAATSGPPAPARAASPQAAGAGRSASLTPTPVVPPLVTARAMARALAGGRSGEAAVSFVLPDPLGGSPRKVSGRVRIEEPDRVRLDFATGERVALRGDGGEWIQPATRQLVRIPAERASAVLRWWRVLLPGSGADFAEESLGDRRYRLTSRTVDDGLVVTARLDARGYPMELAVEGLGEEPVTYHLSGWRFAPGRGAVAYHLTAPPGFETVDLP